MRRAEPRRERGARWLRGIVLQGLVWLFSAKTLVIPAAVVDGGRRTRAERILGFDVCEFRVSGRT